jgi:hypothetical protein
VRLPSTVKFADETVRESYLSLEGELFKQLTHAFEAIGRDAFSGIQIPKRLIPKEYFQRSIPNLWKRNLSNGWRLIYFIVEIDSRVFSIILEWLSHKDYERRFSF